MSARRRAVQKARSQAHAEAEQTREREATNDVRDRLDIRCYVCKVTPARGGACAECWPARRAEIDAMENGWGAENLPRLRAGELGGVSRPEGSS